MHLTPVLVVIKDHRTIDVNECLHLTLLAHLFQLLFLDFELVLTKLSHLLESFCSPIVVYDDEWVFPIL